MARLSVNLLILIKPTLSIFSIAMGNSAGVFGVLAALFRPGLVVPHIVVPDIQDLNWTKIKAAGVSHVIFDKDNCITKALEDSVIPELQSSWQECTSVDFATMLIVSNSAGSSDDPLGVGAEYLSKQLGQLVLAHPSKKPANTCAKQIIDILTQRQRKEEPGHILVIGDRITTDIILASRMQRILQKRGSTIQTVGALTTRVHSRERLGTRVMRGLEMWTLGKLLNMGITPGSSWRSKRDMKTLPMDWQTIATGTTLMSTSASISEIAEGQVDISPPAPLAQRIRALPSRFSGALFLAGSRSLSWLADGWHLINDGIRLGTKGFIGSPDPSLRRTRLHLQGSRTSPLLPSSLQSRAKAFPASSTRLFSSQRHPMPPKSGLQGWPGAIAALVLLPTCWYGGIILHEWMDQRGKVDGETKSNNPIKDPPAFQPSKSASGPPSLASHPQQEQTLVSSRYHLQRELEEIDEKLRRIEGRIGSKQNKSQLVR